MSRAEQPLKFARRTRRLRLIPVAVGLGVTLAVAGCGASQTSQTATQVAAVNGAEGGVGVMQIRDAQLQYPKSGDKYEAGSDAQLVLSVVNGGDRPEQLIKVTSPNAASAEISGQAMIPARFAVRGGDDTDDQASKSAGSASASPSAGPSSSESSSASPNPSASASPGSANPSGANPGAAAPSSSAASQVGMIRIVLKGLTQPINPGQKIEVHFFFRNAGEAVLQLPIAAPRTTNQG